MSSRSLAVRAAARSPSMFLRRLAAAATLAVLAPSAAAGGVWIVQGPSAGHHPDLASAVAAAADGSILVVGSGTYAPFVIDDKSLAIFALEEGTVLVSGTIVVRGLASSKSVLLSGLSATGVTVPGLAKPGLQVAQNQGQVRLARCTFKGGPGAFTCSPHGAGGHGAEVVASPRTAFAGCALTGGKGAFSLNFANRCEGGDGGDGLHALGSSVAIYDCVLRGGDGGTAEFGGGDGGDGGSTSGLGVFAAGSSFRGGNGGNSDAYSGVPLPPPGAGGNGLFVGAATGAHLLDNEYLAGFAGWGLQGSGPHGEGVAGPGLVQYHAGTARSISAPSVRADDQPLALTCQGDPGDRFGLLSSGTPGYRYVPSWTGVLLHEPPLMLAVPPWPLVSPTGALVLAIGLPDLTAPEVARILRPQGIALDASGVYFLASPLATLVLDRHGLPDCNGNGQLDCVDVLTGSSPDANHNLVPDDCGG